jgi:hypothetical protein
MEVICSSETSIDFQRTTRRYIPQDSILQNFSVSAKNLITPVLLEMHGLYGDSNNY